MSNSIVQRCKVNACCCSHPKVKFTCGHFCQFFFTFSPGQIGRKQLVGFFLKTKTNSPALYYFAAAACRWCPNRMIERKACLIEQTFKVKRRFLAERQMLRCNMIVSNKFSGSRELAFIYPYFELIFAKQEWGPLAQFYSILYFINKRQRWTKLQNTIFQIRLFSTTQKKVKKVSTILVPFKFVLKISLISTLHFPFPKR